jgi:tRNA(Ile)-lysidine synthase
MPFLDDRHIPDGSRIVVACSGGGDSVAMLHLLAAKAAGREWELIVAHLDHGLRPASAEEARFTARLTEQLGLAGVVERREVATLQGPGENLESAARRVRYEFLRAVRDETAPGGLIATGHTLDDQLETVALRLERSAGLRGARGILPLREDGVVRPLLGARRVDLREWLTARGLDWVEDESNLDPAFRRNLWRTRFSRLPAAEYEALLEHAARLTRRARLLHWSLSGLAQWWTARSEAVTLPGEIVLERSPGTPVPEMLSQVLLERGLKECGLDAAEVPRRLREAPAGTLGGKERGYPPAR